MSADDLTPPETGTSAGPSQSIATFCLQGYHHGKEYDMCVMVIFLFIFMSVQNTYTRGMSYGVETKS